MKQRIFIPLVFAVLGFCGPNAEAREAKQTPATAVTAAQTQQAAEPNVADDAEHVRERLQDILRGYPRSVGEVLRRDPSLMAKPDYMAPYPQLAAFIAAHPEVPRNVEFYLEGYGPWGRQLDPEFEAMGALMAGLAVFLGVGGFLAVVAWLVRAIIQHRRWLKASQVQADVHSKLMERMSSNEELLAYVQSPAGRRFIEAAPLRPEETSSAPIGSIIFSMMAGIVLSTVGAGFRVAGSYAGEEPQKAFTVVGIIILALGIGFMIASVMAYALSSRLGLFRPKTVESESNA